MPNRRDFLRCAGSGLLSLSSSRLLQSIPLTPVDADTAGDPGSANPNWADPRMGATAVASSHVKNPPWGYLPENVFGGNNIVGWQSDAETLGAWIEIRFDKPREVQEIWLLAEPLSADVLGQDVYLMTYPRTQLLATPRSLRVGLSGGASYPVTLLEAGYFQIFSLPRSEVTSFVRLTVEAIWPKPGASETGIGKVCIFPQRHPLGFDLTAHKMYDVRDGRLIQAATLHVVNPGDAIPTSELRVSSRDAATMKAPLQSVPARASSHQDVWIPSPFEDSLTQFEIVTKSGVLNKQADIQVPSYRSYFDSGSFEFLCTNHNDLGWLNTPALTADYRSSVLILPALELMQKYPEFMYSMESTTYLMEFLERYPEKKDEMAARMREKRFTWGASYVQLLQLSVGPEKLVREFYLGRRWLMKTFPGVDTRFYIQSDPPSMTLQMPQVLAKAGIKYCLLGRLPFGFYNWQSPDGSSVVTRGFRYVDASTLLDPKGNAGWLVCADERTEYYASHDLPRKFVYDYTADYLPPQPDLVPYARRENQRMAAFATAWNSHFVGEKSHRISPPKLSFTTPEKFLDEFTAEPLNITSLYGDWPCAWAYYDEPSNREALLNGRLAHNMLLAAERLYAGLDAGDGFRNYPTQEFADAWQANIWPDHGWGGNRGTVTDKVYADSYAKSKRLAEEIVAGVASKLAASVPREQTSQIPVVVFNPLSWVRTDVVTCTVEVPKDWHGWVLADEKGQEIPSEFLEDTTRPGSGRIIFVAEEIPSVGYRCFYLKMAENRPSAPAPLVNEVLENDFYRVTFGRGGIKSLYDKRQKWEVLRTGKFDGGEVLDFSAPGNAWEDTESVGMQDFDSAANHDFRFVSVSESPVRKTAVREAHLENCTLRESFHLYTKVDRVDIDIEIIQWTGEKARELRVAFPINLDEARLSYEVPFGTVEIGKDELDFTLLPSNIDSQFNPKTYGGSHPLPFREAINWIDASSPNYSEAGCLAASDSTVHVFRDETDEPVSYPVLQHVLLSARKSLAWNPEYWYTQKGNHSYRMSLLPHGGDWRLRYRDAIGFNYRLMAFAAGKATSVVEPQLPGAQSFLTLRPHNLVLTAMKKAEDGDGIILRFYEGEGNKTTARIKFHLPVRQAWKANLIEEEEMPIPTNGDGSIALDVGPWEIVTLKVAV